MTSDQVQIVLVAAACAVAVGAGRAAGGLAGAAPLDPLAARPDRRRRDRLRARRRGRGREADVHLRPRLAGRQPGRGGGRRGVAGGRAGAVGAAISRWSRGAARGRTHCSTPRLVRRRPARTQRAPGALGRAGPHQRAARGVPAARGAAGGVPPRAGLVGLPRPAHAAGRDARDDRGARGRHRRRPGPLPPPDPRRGRPDGRGWSTTSSSCPGSTPGVLAISPEPVVLGDLVSEAIAGRRPGRPRAQRPARRQGRRRRRGHRRRRRAVPGDDEPDHERDPAHPGRRLGRDPRPASCRDGRRAERAATSAAGSRRRTWTGVFDLAWRGRRRARPSRVEGAERARRRAGAGDRQGHRRGAPRRRRGRERRRSGAGRLPVPGAAARR